MLIQALSLYYTPWVWSDCPLLWARLPTRARDSKYCILRMGENRRVLRHDGALAPLLYQRMFRSNSTCMTRHGPVDHLAGGLVGGAHHHHHREGAQLVQLGIRTRHQGRVHLEHDGRVEHFQLWDQLVQQKIAWQGQDWCQLEQQRQMCLEKHQFVQQLQL